MLEFRPIQLDEEYFAPKKSHWWNLRTRMNTLFMLFKSIQFIYFRSHSIIQIFCFTWHIYVPYRIIYARLLFSQLCTTVKTGEKLAIYSYAPPILTYWWSVPYMHLLHYFVVHFFQCFHISAALICSLCFHCCILHFFHFWSFSCNREMDCKPANAYCVSGPRSPDIEACYSSTTGSRVGTATKARLPV